MAGYAPARFLNKFDQYNNELGFITPKERELLLGGKMAGSKRENGLAKPVFERQGEFLSRYVCDLASRKLVKTR